MGLTVGWRFKVAEGSDYQVKELLGTGGYGEVYLVDQYAPISRQLVLKVPLQGQSDPTWKERFEREARILQNVSHLNVVRIVGFWTMPDGAKVLVQELVKGARRLDAYGKTDKDRLPSALLQTLYGLRAFSTVTPPVIHRDLSPYNILINDQHVVKIIDFGIAKEDPRLTATLTRTGKPMGTMGCVAPEQMADAAHVDHRADLYAIGKSFGGALQDRLPGFVEFQKLAEPFKTICERLSAHEPEDRYANVDAAIDSIIELYAIHKVPVANFDLHIHEMTDRTPPPHWGPLCQTYFLGLASVDQETFEVATLLKPDIYEKGFAADKFFDFLEASTCVATLLRGPGYLYDDADDFSRVYEALFPYLDPKRKLRCWETLCRVAIRQNRYYAMGKVRAVYFKETDPTIRTALMANLDWVDPPPHSIYGHGVLPGRDP